MVEVKINASVRPSKTSSYKHHLRGKGLVPAVVYGKGIDNVAIEVDVKDVETAIRKKGRNALIDLALRGKQGNDKYVVMVKEIQRDPIRREIMHVDLCKISLEEKIHTTVPVVFTGEARGLINGGIVQAGLRNIDIECMPANIPENLMVDISSLDIGDHLTVADLPHSENYHITSDQEAVIVTVVAARTAEAKETNDMPGPAVVPAPAKKAEKAEGE